MQMHMCVVPLVCMTSTCVCSVAPPWPRPQVGRRFATMFEPPPAGALEAVAAQEAGRRFELALHVHRMCTCMRTCMRTARAPRMLCMH